MSKEEICPRCGVAKLPNEECVVCAASFADSDTQKPSASDSESPSSQQSGQQLQRPPSQVPLQRPLQSQAAQTRQTEASQTPSQQTTAPHTRPQQGPDPERSVAAKEREALRERLKAASWSATNETTGQPETSGRAEAPPPVPDQDDKQRPALPTANKRILLIGAAVLLLLLAGVGGGWWWMANKKSGTASLPANMQLPEHEHAIAAHHHCKEIVQSELDNPYSAKFPATDYQIHRQQDGSYVVTSWVDEQLASGTRQRSGWRCQVRYIKNMAEASMDELYNAKNWVPVRIGKNTLSAPPQHGEPNY